MTAETRAERLAELTPEELAGERDFLLRSLEDLDAERDAGDLEPSDYDALHARYRQRIEAVDAELRRREETAVEAPVEPAAPAPRRRWRSVVVGACVAAFAVGAGILVAHSSGQRLPGDTATGSVPNNRSQQLIAQALQEFQKGQALQAVQTFQRVLASDPNNAQALAYRGWILNLVGVQAKDMQLVDQGLASIMRAEQVDPSYADPHFFAGMIDLQSKNNPRDAITEFQTYLADNPPKDMLEEVNGELQIARDEAARQAPAGGSLTPSTTVP